MALVNSAFTVNVTPGAMPPIVHVSEYDIGRTYTVTINGQNGSAFNIPTGTTATVEGTLNGSVGFTQSATISNNQVSFALSEFMTAYSGKAWCKIKLALNDEPIQTCAFVLAVDRAGVESDTVVGAPGFDEQIQDAVYDYLDENGQDAVSPQVTITSITGGHRVTITDSEHPSGQYFDVMDGEDGSGGAVESVNGQTGVVVLDASDVGALPDDTPIPAAVTEQTVAGWGFTKNTGTYVKPSTGIPASDLAAGVIPVVPQMATHADMSDWTSGKTVDAATLKTDFLLAVDSIDNLGINKADKTEIPTAVSELTNDSGFVTAQQAAASAPVQSVNGKTGTVVLGASDVHALPDSTVIPPTVTEQTVIGWGFTKNAVRYDEQMALTDTQKATARTNIGAVGELEYDALESDIKSLEADLSMKLDAADAPTKVSDLQNDTGFVTAQQAAAAAPVQSVNGKTGAVTLKTSDLRNDSGFITAQDVPAAPVQSVNSKTGAVTVREVPDAGGATVGQVLTKTADGLGWTTPAGGGDLPDYSHAIDGQVLMKTQDGPRWANNNPSSGAALRLLYDGAFGPDDPELMLMGNVADAETGNAIATALYTGRIGSAVLVDVSNSNTEVVYDLFAVDYDAQTHVSTVTFARTEADCIRTATLSGSTKSAPTFGTIPLGGLPAVTASDNGKFLRVVSGAWAAESVPAAESNSFGGGS